MYSSGCSCSDSANLCNPVSSNSGNRFLSSTFEASTVNTNYKAIITNETSDTECLETSYFYNDPAAAIPSGLSLSLENAVSGGSIADQTASSISLVVKQSNGQNYSPSNSVGVKFYDSCDCQSQSSCTSPLGSNSVTAANTLSTYVAILDNEVDPPVCLSSSYLRVQLSAPSLTNYAATTNSTGHEFTSSGGTYAPIKLNVRVNEYNVISGGVNLGVYSDSNCQTAIPNVGLNGLTTVNSNTGILNPVEGQNTYYVQSYLKDSPANKSSCKQIDYNYTSNIPTLTSFSTGGQASAAPGETLVSPIDSVTVQSEVFWVSSHLCSYL